MPEGTTASLQDVLKARLPPPFVVAALGAVALAGLLVRVVVIRSGFGDFNGDEAYAGLQSLAVVRDHRFPVVIDGQAYSATIEAYLFSPLLVFAGGSVPALKLLYVALWAVATVFIAGAARRLAGGWAAATTAALVWLAPGALLILSTRAYMGYSVGLAAVGASLWSAAVSADRATSCWKSSAITGFTAGLAAYAHPMLLAVVLPALAVVAWAHWRDWRRWWLPAAVGAVIANLPFLAWNAANGWPSLQSDTTSLDGAWTRLRGFVEALLPRGLGQRGFDGTWMLGRPLGLLVYAGVAALVVHGCVVLVRGGTRPSRFIVPAALACCLLLMSPLVNLAFVGDGRYSIIPFAPAAIAIGSSVASWCRGRSVRRGTLVLLATALVWVGLTTVPFLARQDTFDATRPNQWQHDLVTRLDNAGVNRLAGNFWLVMPIEYRSDRRIRIAVVGFPPVVRFPRSQQLVEQAPPDQVAFVYRAGQVDPTLLYLPEEFYTVEEFDGVVLYLPRRLGL